VILVYAIVTYCWLVYIDTSSIFYILYSVIKCAYSSQLRKIRVFCYYLLLLMHA